MKTEFTIEELDEYFNNLTPAEKGMMSVNIGMTLDFILERHFEESNTISLFELVSLVAEEYDNMMQQERG